MHSLNAENALTGPSGDFEQLFQSHYSLIVGTAYRVTGRSEDAEDVLQTVFMRLLKRWDRIDLSDNPVAYLRRAAVNASLDLLRARKRAASVPIDDMVFELEETSEAGPERRRHDAEMRRQLREAVALLSEKSARVFTLRYLEEYDNKEIAKMLGMSQTAVAVVLHRARHKIQEQLGEFIGGIES
jgi:RNA polymerase sigma-70 factor (ECF subfamily)